MRTLGLKLRLTASSRVGKSVNETLADRVSGNPLRTLIPRRKFARTSDKLPRAVFVVGSPRSGTTLFRTMLAGHPGLFVPPELGLLDREDVGHPGLAHDVHRLKEIHSRLSGMNDEDSLEHLKGMESIPSIYAEFKRLAGDRMMIDKTPRYSIDPAVLRRAEEMFADPIYIWITRHPAGVAKSWKGLFPMFFWGSRNDAEGRTIADLGLTQEKIGELTWRLCNGNIEKFLKAVPANRQVRIKYEDLVERPEQTMSKVCEFLGAPFHEATLTPFDGNPSRMSDIKGGGDLRFHTRTEILPSLADSWKDNIDTSKFDEETKALAKRLGYEE